MLLKRIQAPTLDEALKRTRTECGDDALVVETRELRDGFLIVAARPTLPDARQDRTAAPRWTRGFRPLAERAVGFGLSTPVLQALEKAMIGTRVSLDRPGDPAVPAIAARVLAALIKIERAEAHRVLAFVGPTGVGKTTTLAKLAAQAIRRDRASVAIITLDTYRVAAVEQLRAFADMLAAPFEVAFTPQDLRRAVQQHAGADYVLVDTSGRSPFDGSALEALRATLQAADARCALCLPAHARRGDALALLDAFGRLDPTCAVITKWDETSMPGETLSAVIEEGLPLSHITIGQEVPDDIVPADPRALADHAFDLETESLTAP